jgi:hypothetical protein
MGSAAFYFPEKGENPWQEQKLAAKKRLQQIVHVTAKTFTQRLVQRAASSVTPVVLQQIASWHELLVQKAGALAVVARQKINKI